MRRRKRKKRERVPTLSTHSSKTPSIYLPKTLHRHSLLLDKNLHVLIQNLYTLLPHPFHRLSFLQQFLLTKNTHVLGLQDSTNTPPLPTPQSVIPKGRLVLSLLRSTTQQQALQLVLFSGRGCQPSVRYVRLISKLPGTDIFTAVSQSLIGLQGFTNTSPLPTPQGVITKGRLVLSLLPSTTQQQAFQLVLIPGRICQSSVRSVRLVSKLPGTDILTAASQGSSGLPTVGSAHLLQSKGHVRPQESRSQFSTTHKMRNLIHLNFRP